MSDRIIGPGPPCPFCGETYGRHLPRCTRPIPQAAYTRPQDPEPAKGVLAYFCHVEILRTVTVAVRNVTGPGDAARLAEQMVRQDNPDSRVECKQVDYFTETGGESHYYPRV